MKFIFFALAFFSALSLEAGIINVSDINAVNKYAKRGSLVLIGLEETVVFPKQMLGMNAWFHDRLAELKKRPLDEDPLLVALGEKTAITFAVDYETTHFDVEKSIKALALSESWVMGVSHFPISMASAFLNASADLGVDFTSCLSIHRNGWIPHIKTLGQPHKAMFVEDNVLFTGGLINNVTMQEALTELLRTADHRPFQVIYLDSNKENLKSAEEACKRANVIFIGMHYQLAKKRIRRYSEEVAKLQWLQFNNQLSSDYFQALLTYVESER